MTGPYVLTKGLRMGDDQLKFEENDGGRREDYGKGHKLPKQGDCVVRAIATALEQGYKETLVDLCELSIEMGGLPNGDRVYGAYLKSKGWEKRKTLRHGGKKVRVRDWLKHTPEGRYIIHTTKHLTAVIGDTMLDTWDCRKACANIYYEPAGEAG
jgi:hypothetical protein